MGTIIDRSAVTVSSRHNRRSALRLAALTAKACLDAGDCSPSELDLLIITGLYRDRDLGEPALAALIQENIGANPEDLLPVPAGRSPSTSPTAFAIR